MSEFIRIRNKTTGALAAVPEAALPQFYDWEPDPGPPPSQAKPKKNPRRAEASGGPETPDAVTAASSEKEQS